MIKLGNILKKVRKNYYYSILNHKEYSTEEVAGAGFARIGGVTATPTSCILIVGPITPAKCPAPSHRDCPPACEEATASQYAVFFVRGIGAVKVAVNSSFIGAEKPVADVEPIKVCGRPGEAAIGRFV